MVEFYHHSRKQRYRCPQGAAVCNAEIHLSADCRLPSGSSVFIRLWQEGKSESLVPMTLVNGQAEALIRLPDEPCLVWYFFLIRLSNGQEVRYGADTGEGQLCFAGEPSAYQITVYRADFATPKRWREGVCYQIFPDRFRRSSWEDFRNRTMYHVSLGRTVRIHDRWNEAPDWEPAPGQKHYSPDDFFGGDLNGITEKLDDLASLGVTTIYLNPIFESASNHRYNTADYHRIDPILGNEEDFQRLVSEAQKRGIRLILDGVFSHTGADSRYFNKFGRYPEKGAYQGTDSPYYGWYSFTHFPDQYESWWGFDTLPNVKELTPAYADFIAGEQSVLAHWTNYGLGGWRLDVADELPDDFIRLVRKRLKSLDPEAVLIGEVWEDCSNKFGPEGRRDYVDGDVLDSAMNYPFGKAVVSFLTGKTDADALQTALGRLREHYPRPFYEACMNLYDSHDDVRLLYQLAGAPARDALSRSEQHAYRPDSAALVKAKALLASAFLMEVVHPGVPTLYYGDEAGLMGMSDPFNRTTYPWEHEDAEILGEAKRIFSLRKQVRALREGLTRMGALSRDVFCILRYFANDPETVILAVNRSSNPCTVTLSADTLDEGPDANVPVPLDGTYREPLADRSVIVCGKLTMTIEPLSYRLFIKGE